MSSRILVVVAALAAGLLVTQNAAQAEPGGCLKYGAAGAVGGHLAGHGVVGALAGCGAGMWTRHEARKHAAEERNATEELNRQNRAPDYQRGEAPTPFYRQ
jgi:hypothetical protein